MARGLRSPLAIAATVVLIDQLTKEWALDALGDGSVVDVVGSLRFNLAFNEGMAFSQGKGWGPVIGIVALGVVVALLISVGRSASRWYPLAVGLIVGGALGNLTDRLFRDRGWLRGRVRPETFRVLFFAGLLVLGGELLVRGLTRHAS